MNMDIILLLLYFAKVSSFLLSIKRSTENNFLVQKKLDKRPLVAYSFFFCMRSVNVFYFSIFNDSQVCNLLFYCNICISTRNVIRLLILSCLFVLNFSIFFKMSEFKVELKCFSFLSAPYRFTCGAARRPGRRPQQRHRRWPASGERTRRSARRTPNLLKTPPPHRHHTDAPGGVFIPGPH